MIIDVVQKNKELFEANFDIVSENNMLGKIHVKGKLSSMEVSLNGVYNNVFFELKYNGGILFKVKNKKYRPYQLVKNTIITGEIYETNKKIGIFSHYEYNQLNYNNEIYKQYHIALGYESKYPIFLNDIQVSQIDIPNIIYNDLYNYKIYIKNERYSFISIIFVCYMYILSGFKAGQKAKKSVVKYYSKTLNKELKSKYNPDWINGIKKC